jgi:4-hydroxybenzoate polyprenyltransferase
VRQAFILLAVCLATGFLIAWYLGIKFLALLVVYFVMNLGYSMGLKNVSVLDIMIVAFGFSLRLKMGGVIAQLPITEWLNIMIFLLALFIAIGKRYDDLYLRADSGLQMRKAIKGYTIELLNIYLAMVSGVIIVAYTLYTISPGIQERFGTYRLYYTTLFVIAGLLRYLQIVYVTKESGSPTEVLYKDRFLQICILLWVISFYTIIYIHESFF